MAVQGSPPSTTVFSPYNPPIWVTIWFILSTILVAWDCGYLFYRPRSMPGGDLHWIWSPYALYSRVDYVYGWPSLHSKSGFPLAQATLNVVESCINVAYLVYASKGDPTAVLIGFAAVCCTWSKTLLYALNEYFSGWAGVGHNNARNLLLFYILPNGAWLVVPGLLIVVFGQEIARTLRFAAASAGQPKGKRL